MKARLCIAWQFSATSTWPLAALSVRQFTLSGDEVVWMWDDGGVACMALVPPHLEICGEEGPFVFIGGFDGAFVLDFYGVTVLELPLDNVILSVCVFPDGRLATGDDHGCARVFDCDGYLLWETSCGVRKKARNSICALPNGNLFTGGDDGAHILSSSGLYLVKLTDDRVASSCVLPNGNLCVCGRDDNWRDYARVYKLDDKNDLDSENQQDQNDIAEEQEDEFEDVEGEVDSCSQGS